MAKKVIEINPVSRLEGEAKISIFLDKQGNAEDAYFQVTEYRGFEKFCIGRAAEEMPRIVSRICGVCPWPHHIASAKALDKAFHVEPTKTGEDLRRLACATHVWYSHSAHFFALAGPDFVLGPDANPAERNLLGILHADKDFTLKALEGRNHSHMIQAILGGKSVHPITAIPGGMSIGLTEEKRKEIQQRSEALVDFSQFVFGWFDTILDNKKLLGLITGSIYNNPFNYMATVDEKGQIDYYDGEQVIIDPTGKEVTRYKSDKYYEHIGEHCEPWCTAKQTFVRKNGWTGLKSGVGSGIYSVGPLARFNVGTYSTPLAQKAYKKILDTVGKPCHLQLVSNWVRLLEMINAAEIMVDISKKPYITNNDYRVIPEGPIGGRGIGIVEAPRGTLIHDYTVDENAMMTKLNLIVATTHNIAPINISVREAAKQVIKKGNYENEAMLNMVEMAFRSYDPCLACATHAPHGAMPLEIKIFDKDRKLKDVVKRQ
ncbi:MAG: Ni/Fe hydrogenase subunit alpha [Candidatus Heimdallarchaeota archaeon]|nr:Ni/Fe hydrogenase subunit alpha [Candidatus Heimdallarchaeota archaeon]MBY8993441.1 Ni/Fe hydrogenase subunit alpha [Candidatus Heimdallarchaeota archaeon]